MKYLQQSVSVLLTLAATVAVAVGVWWLVANRPTHSGPGKPPPAATVPKIIKEDDLNVVTLTDQAEERLGLTVASVELRPVRRARVYGGEVAAPVGKTVLVSAPLGGTLKAPKEGLPAVGSALKLGQTVVLLLPLLTPEGRATVSAALVDADGQMNTARAQLTLARTALDRAKRVQREGAGSQRQVDEAQTAHHVATRTLEAATARRATLARAIGEGEGGTPTPLAIGAPEDGILRVVSALPGQTVPSGAPLFEVVDLSTVWVRVALPVGDVDDVDRTATVEVRKLSGHHASSYGSATPVTAPPSANPLASTVDVFYEMPNRSGTLTPGQRLAVTVPLADETEGRVVPWSAVVFDIHGNTWVYEKVGSNRYARRRVVVRYTLALKGTDDRLVDFAILASGPAAGSAVVTAGAQELFGAETGFIK